jgi:mRNA interferase MazF
VLVIQNDTSNRYSAVILVAPITTTIRLPLSPVHVLLPAEASTGLALASAAVFNQIRTVDRSRLIRKLGEVDAAVLAQVDDAIRTAFGLSEGEGRTVIRAISEGTGDFRMGRYEG